MALAPQTITLRITPDIAAWIEASRAEGESRAGCLRRVMGQIMRREQQRAERGGR